MIFIVRKLWIQSNQGLIQFALKLFTWVQKMSHAQRLSEVALERVDLDKQMVVETKFYSSGSDDCGLHDSAN